MLLVTLGLLSELILAHHAVLGLNFAFLGVVIVVVRHTLILLLSLFDSQFVLDLLVQILEGLLLLAALVILLGLIQVLNRVRVIPLVCQLVHVLGVLVHQLVRG